MNSEHLRVWKEAVMACLKAPSWYSPGQTEEYQKKSCQCSW